MPSGFEQLPRGNPQHPTRCVCRQHEAGVFAGYDPHGGGVWLPSSITGQTLRRRLERSFQIRFKGQLGAIEWQDAKRVHLMFEEREQIARWRRGDTLRSEWNDPRWLKGVRLGRYPDTRPGRPRWPLRERRQPEDQITPKTPGC